MQNGRTSLYSNDYNYYDRKMPQTGEDSLYISNRSLTGDTVTSRYGRPVLDASKERSRAVTETNPSRDAREALRQAASRRRSLGDQQFTLQLVSGPSTSSETNSTSDKGRRASTSDGGLGFGKKTLSVVECGSVKSTSRDFSCGGNVDALSNGGGALRSRWSNGTATGAAAAPATGVKDSAAAAGDLWWLNRNRQCNKLEPAPIVSRGTSKSGSQNTHSSDRNWKSYEADMENWKGRSNSQPPAWSNGTSSSSYSTSGLHPVPSSPLKKYSSSTTLTTCGREVDAKLDNVGRRGESSESRTAWVNKYLLDRTSTKQDADFDGGSGRKLRLEEPEVLPGRGSSLVASLINSYERVGEQSDLERQKLSSRNVDAAWIHTDADFRGPRKVRCVSLSNLNVVGLTCSPETSSTSDADDRRRSSLHSTEVVRRGAPTSTGPAERRTRAEVNRQQPQTYGQFVALWKARIGSGAEASEAVVATTSKTAASGSSVDAPSTARSSTTTGGVRASAAFPAGHSQPRAADSEADNSWLQRRREEFARSGTKHDNNEVDVTRKMQPKTVDGDWTSLAARPSETLPSIRASSAWSLKAVSNTAASTPSSTDEYAFDLHSRRGSDVTSSASAGTAGSFQSDDSGVVGCGFPSATAVGSASKVSGMCVTKLELPTGLRAAAVSKDQQFRDVELPSSRSAEAGVTGIKNGVGLRGTTTTSMTEQRSGETNRSATQKFQPKNKDEARINSTDHNNITATSSINRPTSAASDIGTRLNSKYGSLSFIEVDADKVDRQTSPSPSDSVTSSLRLQEMISHRRTKSLDELDDVAPVVIKTRRIGWSPSTDLTSSEPGGSDVTTASPNDQIGIGSNESNTTKRAGERTDGSAEKTASGLLLLDDVVLTSTRSRRRSNQRGDSGGFELQLTSRSTNAAADEDSSSTTSLTQSAPVDLVENQDRSDSIRQRIGMDPKQLEKTDESTIDSGSLDTVTACGDSVRGDPGSRNGKGRLEVLLEKGATGLGFCIEGGKGSSVGDKPITVKRLFKSHTSAQESLQVGDEIESVNGKDLTNMSHFEAWNYLKAIPDGQLSLVIIRK